MLSLCPDFFPRTINQKTVKPIQKDENNTQLLVNGSCSKVVKLVSVTGATGFVGRHFVKHLSSCEDVEVRLFIHRDQPGLPSESERISLIRGDILEPSTLDAVLAPDCTVINLAYLGTAPERDHLEAAINLADACARARVKRLVHCSTAVVVGRVPDDLVTEDTPCLPDPGYERTKLEMERRIAEKAAGRFELAILRPTAVFGPGGRNLIKLADDLSTGNRALNYLKSCLFDYRRMNLVSVDHVVAALTFLAFADRGWNGDVFIVSDDDHPCNNFRDVEKYLMTALECHDYTLPRIPFPRSVLATMLRLAGRSNNNPFRRYDDRKLRAEGFRNTLSFEVALEAFANWYKQRSTGKALQDS